MDSLSGSSAAARSGGESPWKSLSRERWDEVHGSGDFDRLCLEGFKRDAMEILWKIYVLAGADTDGDTEWHCSFDGAARATIFAVTDLRADYDESLTSTADELGSSLKAGA